MGAGGSHLREYCSKKHQEDTVGCGSALSWCFQRCVVRTQHAHISAAEARDLFSMPQDPATLCTTVWHSPLLGNGDSDFSLARGSNKPGMLKHPCRSGDLNHLSFAYCEASQSKAAFPAFIRSVLRPWRLPTWLTLQTGKAFLGDVSMMWSLPSGC